MSESQKNKKQKRADNFLLQGAILAIASVLTKIIGVIYRIPLTNILGDEGNGFYGYAYEVYALALILSSLSLPTAVSKLVSARVALKQRRNAFRVFQGSLIFAVCVGLTASLLVFFGADFIAEYFMESPLSAYALKVLACGLFVVAILGVVRGYFQGLGTMVPTAVSQIIEQIVNAFVSIAAAGILLGIGTTIGAETGEELLGPAYGAAGGTLGTVAGAVAALLFLAVVLLAYRKVIKHQIASDRTAAQESYGRICKILLLTVLPVIFSSAIYNINQILDMTIFNKIMAAQGYSEQEYMSLLGIYTGKYNTLINVPLAMANGLAASVIPSMTAAVMIGAKEQVHEKIGQAIRFTMLIAIPCFMGFIVLASPLMVLLYGDSNTTPARMLAIGAVTVILYSWSTMMTSILQGLDKMSVPAKNAAISLVVHLISLFIMLVICKINIYSIVGSNIVFAVCMCILNARAIYKTCGYRQEIKNTFLKPLLAAVIMGIVTYIVYHLLHLLINGRYIETVLSVLAAVAVYAVAILKLGVLSESDLMAFPMGGRISAVCKKLHLLPEKEMM